MSEIQPTAKINDQLKIANQKFDDFLNQKIASKDLIPILESTTRALQSLNPSQGMGLQVPPDIKKNVSRVLSRQGGEALTAAANAFQTALKKFEDKKPQDNARKVTRKDTDQL